MLIFENRFIRTLGILLCLATGLGAQAQTIHVLKFRSVADTKAYFRYDGPDATIISGHRGGAIKGYPENCIPTFEHTLSATPAMFEIDPHLTGDSGIILMHDPSLERTTTGHGRLNKYTLAQVQQLQLKDAEGSPTPYHPETLEEAIRWSIGKTVINLDVKDVPLYRKADLVKKYNAFAYVIFTIHDAKEAKFFYDFDHRSLFSAWVLTPEALAEYEKTGIPWSNFLIAYVGPEITDKNRDLCKQLHRRHIKVMIGAGPSYDKLDTPEARAEAYRQSVKDGADIIESDRPIEVAEAIRGGYPAKSRLYKYQGTKKLK
ncbi:glycerophosphodiester phosphodiesterase family protein [Compostibacter hankyongensis]|uniref:Glycerophosphodiester phosphodiesterase family protein n=1 Tax=Compostibacter hankyongensis TaxID=1007089 RepID=A0ABP8FUK8_9BACT